MEISKKDWNDRMLKMNSSFLQSWEWGTLQESLGRKVKRFALPNAAASVIKFKLPLGKNYLYSPRGPVFDCDENESIDDLTEKIKSEFRDEKTIFFRIEPACDGTKNNIFRKNSFIKSFPVQPTKTLILDLTKPEENLFKDMEHDTRYSIRSAEKRGVIVSAYRIKTEKENVFDKFWSLFEETNLRNKLQTFPKRYYSEIFSLDGDCRSEVFIAELNCMIIALAVIVFWGKTATYLYAASDKNHSRFNAPSLVLWKAITEAKKRGCAIFDFWGISYQKKKWAGITAFKKSFGGHEKNYIGSGDFPYSRKWYLLYRLAKKFENHEENN